MKLFIIMVLVGISTAISVWMGKIWGHKEGYREGFKDGKNTTVPLKHINCRCNIPEWGSF